MDRQREVLTTAWRIVLDEGLPALTLPRLAGELGSPVDALSRQFASEGAIVAALQREAIDVLTTSLRLSQAHLGELVATADVTPPVAALVRVVAAARFWIEAEAVYAEEVDLLRRAFFDSGMHLAEADAAQVVPAAFELLAVACGVLDGATDTGGLAPGSSLERALVVIAGTSAVLMTSNLARWDPALADGSAVARSMVTSLLVGWGADPAHLAAADVVVDRLVDQGRLVPD
jgi:AcrR family transcriptional regulator